MRKMIILMAILLQVVIVSRVKAQIDPHFSQYYAYPLWLNPALTGVMDGDSRVTANFKNQWSAVSNAYQTGALSYDFVPYDKVGVGINVIDQKAGSAGYNYLAAYASFGYGINLSDDEFQQLHFGVQAGIINRSFNTNKLQFDDQYDPESGFDPNLPSFETFANTSKSIFDAGAGIYYFQGDPDARANFFGGFSVAHLTQPSDKFTTEGISSSIPMRFTIHGGVRINAADFLDLTPNVIYIKQQKAQEKDLGMQAQFKSDQGNGFLVGFMYRFGDAAIADVGYKSNNFTVGMSYDYNTSSLSTATKSQGGFELSISYTFSKNSFGNGVKTPSF